MEVLTVPHTDVPSEAWTQTSVPRWAPSPTAAQLPESPAAHHTAVCSPGWQTADRTEAEQVEAEL